MPDRSTSALIVPLPAAGRQVDTWRRRHDPSGRVGLPAHVTLLTPFVPPDAIDEALIDQLRRVFASTPPFAVALRRTARFAETVFLAPDPEAPFRALTRRLNERWPEHPPYGDPDLDPTPHLTVAHGVGEETLARVGKEVATVLPIEDWAHEVLLITGSNEGEWGVRSRLSLGGPDGGRCRQGPV